MTAIFLCLVANILLRSSTLWMNAFLTASVCALDTTLIHTYIHMYIWLCMHISLMHIWSCVICLHIQIYKCINYISIYTYIHMYECVCVCICICSCCLCTFQFGLLHLLFHFLSSLLTFSLKFCFGFYTTWRNGLHLVRRTVCPHSFAALIHVCVCVLRAWENTLPIYIQTISAIVAATSILITIILICDGMWHDICIIYSQFKYGIHN